MAITSDGKLWKDEGDRLFRNGTAIATGLNPTTTKSQFVTGGEEVPGNSKKLFYFSFENQLKVIDGDANSIANISNPASDWTTQNYPTAGVIYRNRLWAFMKSNAYASKTDDHEDFTDASALLHQIFPGQGGDIVGGVEYQERLFVVKQGGYVYYLVDTAADADNWYFLPLGKKFELASIHAFIDTKIDLIAGTESNDIASLTATEKLGSVDAGSVIDQLGLKKFMSQNTSPWGAQWMHSLFYSDKQKAYFTFRKTPNTENDRLAVIETSFRRNWRMSMNSAFQCNVLALRKDTLGVERPIFGDNSGFVHYMDREDRLINGAGFTSTFQTNYDDLRHFHPKLRGLEKHFDWFAVEYIEKGRWPVTVTPYVDQRPRTARSVQMSERTTTVLGSFKLGTTRLTSQSPLRSPAYPIDTKGQSIAFRVVNGAASQNFQITAIVLGFRGAGYNAAKLGE